MQLMVNEMKTGGTDFVRNWLDHLLRALEDPDQVALVPFDSLPDVARPKMGIPICGWLGIQLSRDHLKGNANSDRVQRNPMQSESAWGIHWGTRHSNMEKSNLLSMD